MKRMAFVVDPVDQPRYATIPYDAGMWIEQAKVWPRVQVEVFEPFAQQHRRFLLLSMPADQDYLLPMLEARHAEGAADPERFGDDSLFREYGWDGDGAVSAES